MGVGEGAWCGVGCLRSGHLRNLGCSTESLRSLDTGHDCHNGNLSFEVLSDTCSPDNICVRVKFVGQLLCDFLCIVESQIVTAGDVNKSSGCTAEVNVKERVGQTVANDGFCLVPAVWIHQQA